MQYNNDAHKIKDNSVKSSNVVKRKITASTKVTKV